MELGFIGLGAMGLPMTRHLLAAGHDVTVASRSRHPIDAAVAAGAREAAGPAAVVAASEITLLCVPDSPDVVSVLDEAMPALAPGKLVIDTSTIDPGVEREQHARVTATGAEYLDAPVAVTRACCSRSTPGSIVEVSITSFPGASAGMASSSTETTSGESGTHNKVISDAATTAAGPAASRAPAATAASIGWRLRDATVTSWPAARRWRVIGNPIAPSPMNPSSMREHGNTHYVRVHGRLMLVRHPGGALLRRTR